MGKSFKISKVELLIAMIFIIAGGICEFFMRDLWHLGILLSAVGYGGIVEILVKRYYYNKE